MTQLFSKKASLWFRGLAILLVIASHYAEWWAWFTPSEGNAELFRQACSRLGPYGVAIFFLFSGYGLARSAGDGPMTLRFILRRVLASYLPYLIVAGIIDAMSGGFSDPEDFLEYLYGHDYWFMVVLFQFYIGFILIWTVPHRHFRGVLFSLFVLLLSWRLYQKGEHSFWYISNPAFGLGALLALYEPFFRKVLDKSRPFMLALLSAAMGIVIYFGLYSQAPALWSPEKTVRYELLAVQVWTLLIIWLAPLLNRCDPLLCLLGKYSLYLYLTHQFLFLRTINGLGGSFSTRFLAAAAITLAASLALGAVISRLSAVLLKKMVSADRPAAQN